MSTSHLDWFSRMAFAWVLRGKSSDFERDFGGLLGALREEHRVRERRGQATSPFADTLSAACEALVQWVLGDKIIGTDGEPIGLPCISGKRESFAASLVDPTGERTALRVALGGRHATEENVQVRDISLRVRHFEHFETRSAALWEFFQAKLNANNPPQQQADSATGDGFSLYRWDCQLVLSWCMRQQGSAFVEAIHWLLGAVFELLILKMRRLHVEHDPFLPDVLEAVCGRLSVDLFEPKQIDFSTGNRTALAAAELWLPGQKPNDDRTMPTGIPDGAILIGYTIGNVHRQEKYVNELRATIDIYPHATEAHRVLTIKARVDAYLEGMLKYGPRKRRLEVAMTEELTANLAAPNNAMEGVFRWPFVIELGRRFPKVLIHLLVKRKVYRYKKSEVFMDLAEARAFLARHLLIDETALGPYFDYLESNTIKNHDLTYRHRLAFESAQALLRARGDWSQALRLVHRVLHGTGAA